MIREAVLDDAAQIAEIHVYSWQATCAKILPARVLALFCIEAQTEKWRSMLEAGERVLLAEMPEGLAGWISFGPCRDEGRKNEGEVYAIYLHPNFYGQGVGTLLMREAERRLEGVLRISVWVLEKNERTRRFYEHLGYLKDTARKEVPISDLSLTAMRYQKKC